MAAGGSVPAGDGGDNARGPRLWPHGQPFPRRPALRGPRLSWRGLRGAAKAAPGGVARAFPTGFALMTAATFVAVAVFFPDDRRMAAKALGVAGGAWALTLTVRWLAARLWPRRVAPMQISAVAAAVLALFAAHLVLLLDGLPEAAPDPAGQARLIHSPDLLATLLAFLGAVAAFVAWWGNSRRGEMAAALALVAVLLTPFFEATTATNLGTAMLWAAALALVVQRPPEARQASPFLRLFGLPAAAFVASAALSSALAISVYPSALFTTQLAALVLFFWLAATRLRWQDGLVVLAALLATAFLLGAVQAWEVAGLARSNGLGFALLTRQSIHPNAHPNPVALTYALGLVGAVALVLAVPHRWLRGLVVGMAVVALFGFFMAFSASGFLGLAAGLVVLAAVGLRRWLRQGFGGRARSWKAVVATLVVVMALAVLLASPFGRPVLLLASPSSSGAGEARFFTWSLALRNLGEHPLAGVGYLNDYSRTAVVPEFPFRDVTKVSERQALAGVAQRPWVGDVVIHAHNSAVAVAEAGGSLGLLAYAGLLVAVGGAGFRLLRWPGSGEGILVAATGLAGVATVLAWSMGALGRGFTVPPSAFWPLLGLAAAGVSLGTEEGGSLADPRRGPGRWWRRAAVGVAVLVVALFLVARPLLAEALERQSSTVTSPQERADLLRLAAALDPLDADLDAALARLEASQGNLKGAGERLAAAARKRERDPRLEEDLGWLSWLQGDVPAAEAHFARAVFLDPWAALSPDAPLALALARANLDDITGAAEALVLGIQVNPTLVTDGAWLPVSRQNRLDWVFDPAYLEQGEPSEGLGVRLRNRLLAQAVPYGTPPPEGPTAPVSLRRVFELLAAAADEAAAAGDLRTAAGRLESLGRAELLAAMPAEAVEHFRRLVELEPDAAYAIYALAGALEAAGESKSALEELQRTLRLIEGEGGSLYEPFVLRDIGILWLARGEPERAVAALRQAREVNPTAYLPELYPNLALAEAQAGHLEAALGAAQGEAFFRGKLNVGFLVADIYLQLGKPEEAAAAVMENAPGGRAGPSPDFFHLGEMARRLRQAHEETGIDVEGGLAFIDARWPAEAGAPKREILKAIYASGRGERAAALQFYLEAVSLRPGDANLRCNVAGDLLRYLGLRQEAQVEAAAAILAAPNAACGYEALADTLEPALAADLYAAAVERGPNDTRYRKLADAQLAAGDPAGALEAARGAVSLNPSSAENYVALGEALLASGEVEAARAAADVARGLDPDAPGLADLVGQL